MSMQQSALRILRLTIPLPMMLSLMSCAAVGNCELLSVKDYDAAFTSKFTEQYSHIMAGSELDRFVLDARALRQAVRACKGVK